MFSSSRMLAKCVCHVDSLFTNIPLEEGLNKSEFKDLLSLATKESYFIFNEFSYKNIDDVAKGLEQCPEESKLVYYKRYADDIFILFRSRDHLMKFRDYAISK